MFLLAVINASTAEVNEGGYRASLTDGIKPIVVDWRAFRSQTMPPRNEAQVAPTTSFAPLIPTGISQFRRDIGPPDDTYESSRPLEIHRANQSPP